MGLAQRRLLGLQGGDVTKGLEFWLQVPWCHIVSLLSWYPKFQSQVLWSQRRHSSSADSSSLLTSHCSIVAYPELALLYSWVKISPESKRAGHARIIKGTLPSEETEQEWAKPWTTALMHPSNPTVEGSSFQDKTAAKSWMMIKLKMEVAGLTMPNSVYLLIPWVRWSQRKSQGRCWTNEWLQMNLIHLGAINCCSLEQVTYISPAHPMTICGAPILGQVFCFFLGSTLYSHMDESWVRVKWKPVMGLGNSPLRGIGMQSPRGWGKVVAVC